MNSLSWSDVAAVVALVFSAYSLWQTSLRPATLQMFVPPVVSYASPFQNSNFEAFAIPITITNEGARTGTILSMTLVVTDPQQNVSKSFYSANFGQWTNDKFRSGEFKPFAPLSILGRTSLSDTVQFYARSDETVMQIVRAAGRFQFAITLDSAASKSRPLTFEMVLPELDQRSFTGSVGAVALHQKEWQSSTRAA